MRHKCVLALFVAALLFSSLASADSLVIKRGIDVFTTTANGKTFYDFAKNPVPAGFFCADSAAYTGRVILRGLPIETAAPGQLRGADTVVERLDDARFNEDGVAETRVKFRALSLVSVAPIRTSCGAFHVYVSLAGKQRATTMRIHRTHEAGGSFEAPLDVSVRLSFVPVKGASPRKLELPGNVHFPAKAIPWSFEGGRGMKRIASAVIDTDGDQVPDTRVSGTSNFASGWSVENIRRIAAGSCTLCEPEMCHSESGEQHCTGPIYACYPAHCP